MYFVCQDGLASASMSPFVMDGNKIVSDGYRMLLSGVDEEYSSSFSNNTLYKTGFRLSYGKNFKISGNSFNDCSTTGDFIELENTVDNIMIDGNFITGEGSTGGNAIQIPSSATNINIANNLLHLTKDVIVININTNCDGIYIHSNQILDSPNTAPIYINNGVDNCVVTNNMFSNCEGTVAIHASNDRDVQYITLAPNYAVNGAHQTYGRRISWGTAAPTTGSSHHGDIIYDLTPTAGDTMGWVCTESGTFGAATDNTGDTDGSTAVITGMADTADFYLGDFVDVSAGFPTTGPYEVRAKTATTLTISIASDSAESNITVDTSDPVFKTFGAITA